MAVETQTNPTPASYPARRGGVVAGGILITVGALALLGQLLPGWMAGQVFLLVFGAAFLVWGFLSRHAGLLIPGSIISGLGLGVLFAEQYRTQLPEPADGGVVLVGLALGFAAITVFTALVTRRVHWWPLIPASVVGLLGSALVASAEVGPAVVLLNQVWPLFLIGLGVVLLLRRGR